MLFLIIFGEVTLQFIKKNNWKCVFILLQIHTWHRCLKLAFFDAHLCEVFENCSIQLSNDWNNFYETTEHLHKFRTDKLSTFSKAKPLRSPRLVSLSFFNFNQIWNVATHRKVFAPFLFIAFDRQIIPFFGLLYSCVPFFHFFSSRFSLMSQ